MVHVNIRNLMLAYWCSQPQTLKDRRMVEMNAPSSLQVLVHEAALAVTVE
jgi:hypothetical protein